MTLQLGVGSPGAGASSAPNGWVFESSTEDGRQRKCLAVAGAAITFQTYEYSRWATVWEEVGGLLTMVMEHIGSENGLRAVHIDFINRFIWGGDISSATTGDLLTESNYVAANTLTCTSLWHSHHGYLQVEDGPSSHGDYLVNINLQSVNAAISEQNDDLSEGVVKRCIDVVLTHRFTSNDQKGMGVEATASSKANLIGQQLLRMRVRNKEILRAIIVSDVVKLIPGLAEA